MLLLATLIWSLHWPVIKYALDEGVDPFVYVALRTVVGTVVFTGLAVRFEGSVRIARADTRALVACAAFGIVAYQACLVLAVERSTASTSALAYGTVPIFVALFARLARAERLAPRVVVAAVVSFGGVALVALGAEGGLSGSPGGIGLAVAAALSWGAYTVAVVPLMARYSALRVSAAVLLVGVVPLTAVASVQLVREQWSEVGALAWLAVGYGLVLAYVLNTLLWYTAVGRVGPSRSALYANLQPFLGAVFALALLSERLGAVQVAGGVVIAASIAFARRGRSRPGTPPASDTSGV